MARESVEAAAARWEQLELLQTEYRHFSDFLYDVFDTLGFDDPTWMQLDIADYMQYGPDLSMVMAQREESKTTIAAAYAVWKLIHDPKHRVLVVSAGGPTAKEISTLIVNLIQRMDVLSCLRPDPAEGDRTSVEAFDVHYTLKGIDKSPSVACVGIFGTLQGKRADLLIADDVESTKNGLTATQREQLRQLCRDFPDICKGRILYIGTPQSKESIYNELPNLGFVVRIWTGRYPTPEQMKSYGDMLAPALRERLDKNPELATGGGMLRNQGQVTDPMRINEEVHQKLERAKGTADYQLQYMLSTELLDKNRHPLKTDELLIMRCDPARLPESIVPGMTEKDFRIITHMSKQRRFLLPLSVSPTTAPATTIIMAVDPAAGGENADETGYAVVAFLNSTLYVLAAGGIKGGYEKASMEALAAVAEKWKPNRILVEKNMGYGAFTQVWMPVLLSKYKGAVDDVMSHGQKELRIIGTLGPIMGRGSLVLNESVLADDEAMCEDYDVRTRSTYSLINQLASITRARKSLKHDDRLDALEIACRYFLSMLALDQEKAEQERKRAEHAEWMRNPLRMPSGSSHISFGGAPVAAAIRTRGAFNR